MFLEQIHIQQLAQYLTESGLTHKEVREDVLDHMCTEVEILMGEGKSYASSLEEVQNHFPPEMIADIQQDTIYYLTIKSTIAMIKGIFISGYAAVCLYALSFGMYSFLLVFTDVELAFLLSSLLKFSAIAVFCFAFLPLLFRYGYQRFTTKLVG